MEKLFDVPIKPIFYNKALNLSNYEEKDKVNAFKDWSRSFNHDFEIIFNPEDLYTTVDLDYYIVGNTSQSKLIKQDYSTSWELSTINPLIITVKIQSNDGQSTEFATGLIDFRPDIERVKFLSTARLTESPRATNTQVILVPVTRKDFVVDYVKTQLSAKNLGKKFSIYEFKNGTEMNTILNGRTILITKWKCRNDNHNKIKHKDCYFRRVTKPFRNFLLELLDQLKSSEIPISLVKSTEEEEFFRSIKI